VNAAVSLIERVIRSSVHIQSIIPEGHPSSGILGTERMGSGAVVDASGLVLTVNYVVLGADEIHATLLDGREFVAEVAAQDFASGLALLRLPAEDLPALPVRASTDLRLGDEVFIMASAGEAGARIASGNVTYIGPFDANWEYTLDRAIMTTALNPGLGGGPLVDRLGHAVGIVSLSLNEIARFSLAIPAECFLAHRDELIRHGRRTTVSPRAWMGVFCYTLRDHVVIAGLLPGSPAERAGLKAGDVILTIDGRDIADRRALYQQLWTHRAGDPVSLKVFRNNEVRTVEVATADAEEFFA
jgi:S1-C subfamily serine protease